jgi:putative transposase
MPNHVHLVAVPRTPEGLARAIGEAHRRYTRRINFRKEWRGYLWQGRFASCVMDREHGVAAARYIERNPVRAGLVKRAWEWPWSSAAAHVAGRGEAMRSCSVSIRLHIIQDAGCHGCAVCSRDLRRTTARLLNGATVAPDTLHGR